MYGPPIAAARSPTCQVRLDRLACLTWELNPELAMLAELCGSLVCCQPHAALPLRSAMKMLCQIGLISGAVTQVTSPARNPILTFGIDSREKTNRILLRFACHVSLA